MVPLPRDDGSGFWPSGRVEVGIWPVEVAGVYDLPKMLRRRSDFCSVYMAAMLVWFDGDLKSFRTSSNVIE